MPVSIQGLMLDAESIITNMSSKTVLDRNFEGLDASNIWMPYWVSSVMDMFNTKFVYDNRHKLFNLLKYFIKKENINKNDFILKCSNLTYKYCTNSHHYINKMYADSESLELYYFCGSYGHTIQLGSFYMGIYNLYLIQSEASLRLL